MAKNIDDYLNKKYNMLTIIKRVSNYKDGSIMVECVCECGKVKNIVLSKVLNGKTKSCGCIYNHRMKESAIGKKYNKLTVKEFHSIKNERLMFKFKCDCGNEKVSSLSEVKNGSIKSCGCMYKTQEGLSSKDGEHRKLYTIYRNMISRCYNENDMYYSNYGGRGITVCDNWKENYINFYKDITNNLGLPREKDTIDRIDNDKGYYLENIKWSTMTEQNYNRRSKFHDTPMKNIYKRGNKFRVKISRYGIVVQSKNIDSLDRAKLLRDYYVELFSGNEEECIKKYKEQCYLKK